MVLDVLGDPIHLVLRLVDLNHRVGAGDSVDLPCLLFLLEHGSLPDAD